jgi:hypothetical protein
VYESKTFTCQDIEYGNVDDTTLGAALVAEVSIDAAGTKGALDGLSRTDDKLIVARGYDMAGIYVAAGCVDKGVVSGSDKVEIDTVATAAVSLVAVDANGTSDIYGISTTVTDVTGMVLDGRQVWWRVFGPAGTQPDNRASNVTTITDGVWEPTAPSCTSHGELSIHPVPPSLIGGFAVEVRLAWGAYAPRMFSSFTKVDLGLTPVTLPATVSEKFCARHVSGGSAKLTCLDNSSGTLVAADYAATVSSGVVTLSKGATATVPSDAIALYEVANGANHDVYAATATCAIAPLFGAGGGHVGSCTGADEILLVPACGTETAKLLFHVPGGVLKDQITQVDLSTGAATTLVPGFAMAENRVAFNAAGCVSELDPTGGPSVPHQMIVLDYTIGVLSPSTRGLYKCPACLTVPFPIPLAAVGFTGGTESRMVVTLVDASGVLLSQDVLLPSASAAEEHFVERAREFSASLPVQVVAGNFDGDDGTDLLWDISSRRGTSFEIGYARLVGDQPLAALATAQGVTVSQLLVGDFTNDSYDDVVLLGATLETSPKRGVAVLPSRVAPENTTLKPDQTCTP